MTDSTPRYGLLPITQPADTCPVCQLRLADAAHQGCCSEPCARSLHRHAAQLLRDVRRAQGALLGADSIRAGQEAQALLGTAVLRVEGRLPEADEVSHG